MNELNILRKKIDKIDKKLLPLFIKRMGYSAKVAEYKSKCGMPVLDTNRERSILDSRAKMAGSENEDAVRRFFSAIMAISRSKQHKILNDTSCSENTLAKFDFSELKDSPTVAYQGIAGAYSEAALMKMFGEDCERINCQTFDDVFRAVERGDADYGVLPLENSHTGSISDVYDLLAENDFYIIGETYVPVEHCLVALDGAEISSIKTVYSHEQGFLQCRDFFKAYPDIEFHPYYNTAISAKLVADSGDKTVAAIASKRTADLYGLTVLAENINKSNVNTTRFAAVSKRGIINERCSKISVMFKLANESGSLSGVLTDFADNGLNLVKLESRPRHDKNFEYIFFVDLEGNLLDDHVRHAIERISDHTPYLRLFGNYPAGI